MAPCIKAKNLSLDRIKHGFFTRVGGVSDGIYASLNCGPGSNDVPESIAENRKRACASLGTKPESLRTLYQIHSADVCVVENTEPFTPGYFPKADALVTKIPGITLGILTADCAPILFADSQNKIIGAAHAGWKGALSGVIEATVNAMENLGAERRHIHACIGPCIAKASYEVRTEFRDNFLNASKEFGIYFTPSPNSTSHYYFDLGAFVTSRLHQANIASAHDVALDTYPDAERFFSYRRTTHRKEVDYGRQLSAIALA